MQEWMVAVALPVAGWVLYVEKRIAAIKAIEEKVDALDAKVERLVDHLLGAKSETQHQARR